MNLDSLSDSEIKTLYEGILAMRRTKAGHQLIDQAIAEIREGKFQAQQHPTPVRTTQEFVNSLEQDVESFLDRN